MLPLEPLISHVCWFNLPAEIPDDSIEPTAPFSNSTILKLVSSALTLSVLLSLFNLAVLKVFCIPDTVLISETKNLARSIMWHPIPRFIPDFVPEAYQTSSIGFSGLHRQTADTFP